MQYFSKASSFQWTNCSLKSGLPGEDIFKFSNIVEIQGQTETYTENISDGKEMTGNLNDIRSNTEFASVEDSLNMHRTASKEITLVSEISNIIDEENVIICTTERTNTSFNFK